MASAFCTGSRQGRCLPFVHGLSALPEPDVQAIATYFADIDHAASPLGRRRSGGGAGNVLCAPRHRAGFRPGRAPLHGRLRVLSLQLGRTPLAVRPDLALNSAVNLPDPTNLIQVMLRGVTADEGMPGVVMPSFAHALSDADIARIAAYLRRTRTNLSPWPDLDSEDRRDRGQINASQ